MGKCLLCGRGRGSHTEKLASRLVSLLRCRGALGTDLFEGIVEPFQDLSPSFAVVVEDGLP